MRKATDVLSCKLEAKTLNYRQTYQESYSMSALINMHSFCSFVQEEETFPKLATKISFFTTKFLFSCFEALTELNERNFNSNASVPECTWDWYILQDPFLWVLFLSNSSDVRICKFFVLKLMMIIDWGNERKWTCTEMKDTNKGHLMNYKGLNKKRYIRRTIFNL